MNKLFLIGAMFGLLLISILPLSSAMTNIETIKNTVIITTQIYNPINYPIAIDTTLIQNGIVRFISFRDVIDYVLVGINKWA